MEIFGSDEINVTAESVERQLDLWNALRRAELEKRRSSSGPVYRYLTIARDEGSLGDEIAREMGRLLEWHVFDKEIVTYIARNSHVRDILVRQLDEKSQSLVQDMISRLLRMPEYGSFGREEYQESLSRTLVYIARNGSAILVGRGANFVLGDDSQGLKVRIAASPEVRVRRLQEAWNVKLEEAHHRMQAEDEERRKFIRQYFRRDFDDFRSYDVVISTDHLSVTQAAQAILTILKSPRILHAGLAAPA